MDLQLTGRSALVTGAAGGIGRAASIALAREGAAAVVVHFNQDESGANGTAAAVRKAGARPLVLRADLTNEADVEAMAIAVMREVGPIDVLVNNAGSLIRRCEFLDSDIQLWKESIDINLLTAYRITARFLPAMIKAGWGRIIMVSSLAARTGDTIHYAVAKAGLVVLARGLSSEVARFGVTVNAVAPGYIDTQMHERFHDVDRRRRVVRVTPVGRVGTPDEIADWIVFLASEQSGFTTGETIYVTGGR